MKVLATADFHGNREAFQRTRQKAQEVEADAIVVCGDITHFGSPEQAVNLLSLLQPNGQRVLYVPGNCDSPALAEHKMERVECIHGRCIRVGSVDLLGIGGSSATPFGTPFEYTEKQIAEVLEHSQGTCMNDGRDLFLVSHSPPKNTKVDLTSTRQHVGSLAVREFIEQLQPLIVVCGHIHEAVGVDKLGKTSIVNPGPANHGMCAVIDIMEDIQIKLSVL